MKTFATKKELFKYLVDNKDELINLRKSAIKHADVCDVGLSEIEQYTTKASKYLYENNKEAGTLKRTIVLNTYNWMDSHNDVHLSGVFSKSIKEKSSMIPHLHDHVFALDARVGKPISFSEKQISWRELGIGKTGMTEGLFMESEIRKSYNEKVYDDYLNDEIKQHSVAMRYIKMALAVNDPEEYPNEYKVWNDVIGLLGNRKAAEAQGYFFAVYEAALIEGSAVLLGSNELTPTLGKSEPLVCTQKDESEDTRNAGLLEAINKLSTLIN